MTVSVIVPVYNAEKYLQHCVNSILGQTYKETELILVDDGSTDMSGKICDKYSKMDKRVITIHKTNGGSSNARKAGLAAAKGQYIGFVDADDWIESDYFEKMVKAQQDTGADIVVSNHFHDIGADSKKVCSNFPAGLYPKELLLPTLLYSGQFFEYGLQPHMVTKLFRKEILLKTQMCVDGRIIIGEDAAVVYPSVLEADTIYISDICGYHYVQRLGSMTKKETHDETGIYRLLFEHLENAFRHANVWSVMASQMEQYKKYLLFMRQMQSFDDRVLLPFGGINRKSRVVIYGAGVLGQKMYNYLSAVDGMEVVLWVDKNYMAYQKNGMNVNHPEKILSLIDYDYILIANTVQRTADSIRQYLDNIGIVKEKIKWFSEEFVNWNR